MNIYNNQFNDVSSVDARGKAPKVIKKNYHSYSKLYSEILPPWKYIPSRLRFWEIYTEDFEKSLIAKHAMRLPSLAMAGLIYSWLRFKLFKGFFFLKSLRE